VRPIRCLQTVSLIAVLLLFLIVPLSSAAETPAPPGSEHMRVTGVVSKIQSGLIYVETPVGTLHLTSKSGIRDGHPALKVGDTVTVWVNEDNIVVDVHKKGDVAIHRFVTGKLSYANEDKSAIKLWTPDGPKTFSIKQDAKKFSTLPVGTPVTVELNESGQVIDIHRADKPQAH